MKPILPIGGYGVLGREVARRLRTRHPDLPLVIAGRDPARASAAAAELRRAEGLRVELGAGDAALGLSDRTFSAVGVFLKDETLDALVFAGQSATPYLNVTNGAFEAVEEFTYGLTAGRRAPIALAGHCFCGAATFAALALARAFARVDRVEVGIVVDRRGSKSGLATTTDFERILGSCPSTLLCQDGRYKWVPGEGARGEFSGAGGRRQSGTVSVGVDALSIGAGCGARSVRVLEVFGESASRAPGGGGADEISLEIFGAHAAGAAFGLRQEISAPRDSVRLTPLIATLLLERLSGLVGTAPAPGIYLPEHLVSPTEAVASMAAAGVEISEPVEISAVTASGSALRRGRPDSRT